MNKVICWLFGHKIVKEYEGRGADKWCERCSYIRHGREQLRMEHWGPYRVTNQLDYDQK